MICSNALSVKAEPAPKECPPSPTKQNVMPDYANAVPSACWQSVNHSDYPQDADLAASMPPSAGASVKPPTNAPSYYAWAQKQGAEESEYNRAFHYEPTVCEHVKTSTKPTLVGVFQSQSGTPAPAAPAPAPAAAPAATKESPPEPEAESAPFEEPAPAPAPAPEPEPAAAADAQCTDVPPSPNPNVAPWTFPKAAETNMIGMSSHYVNAPSTEYNSNFHESASGPVVHVKKSAEATLEGVFAQSQSTKDQDQGLPNTLDGVFVYDGVDNDFVSTNHASFPTGAGATEQVKHVKKSAEATLEGVLAPSANPWVSATPESGTATLSGVFKYKGAQNNFHTENQDSYVPRAMEHVEHVHKSQEATLDGVFSKSAPKATAPAPAPAPAAEEAPAPVVQEEVAAAPAPAPVVEESAAPAPAVEEAAAPAAGEEMCFEAPEPAAAADAEPAAPANPWSPAAAPTGKNPVVYQSTSHSSFAWPKAAAPTRPVPLDGDLIGGTTGPKPNAPVQEEALKITMHTEKEGRFTTEYNSKFHLPKENMNKRAINAKNPNPDSLWVCGVKGENNVLLKPVDKSEKQANLPTGYATIDHLRGTSAMPRSADSLEVYSTTREELVPKSKVTSKDPQAGYVPPAVQKNILRSKDQPIPGQIPHLREMPDPLVQFERAPIVAPPVKVADPILMYRRYPQLSDKQANRFATTSRSSYKWQANK